VKRIKPQNSILQLQRMLNRLHSQPAAPSPHAVHVKSGPLKGFSFRDQETATLAERLLWSPLPNKIVITGPVASGKTHLAKLLLSSNNCTAVIYTGKVSSREYGRMRSDGWSVIFDDLKARDISPDFDFLMNRGEFYERKLGVAEYRRSSCQPPLIIITTNDDAAIANLEGEFYLIALAERPGAWKKRPTKRSSSSKPKGKGGAK